MSRPADWRQLALRLFDVNFGGSWAAWRTFLLAAMGRPVPDAELPLYQQCTGRAQAPAMPAREVWAPKGRRAGGSRMLAFLLVVWACFRKYDLAPGERATCLIIAADRKQARTVFGYVLGFVESTPALAALIVRQTQDAIELNNGVSIEIATASFRTTRGYKVVFAGLDEAAFFSSDDGAANPDTEIVRALRPSLASVPESLLVGISSPYAQRGELFKHYERYFGRDGDILVWQAATRTMNPTIPQSVIDQALDEDPVAAAAEWLAQFRSDIESLFSRDVLDAVTIRGRYELAPQPGTRYTAFIDPSGGSADSMTLGIGHRDLDGRAILDCVREAKPPFSPELVVGDFVRELKRYGVTTAFSDRYGGEWVVEAFRKFGVTVTPSELTRSEIYLESVAAINSGQVALLDHPRMLGQLAGLERRVGRSGKDAVDHRIGQHDDVANAGAGALVFATRNVGLPLLPADFSGCNRMESGISTSGVCYLFGGLWRPPMDACCGQCAGHLFVSAARRAYTDRTGEGTDLIAFYRDHVARPDWVQNRWTTPAYESLLQLFP